MEQQLDRAAKVAGIKTSTEMKAMLCGLITDICTGAVTSQEANAVCREVGKILKATEAAYRMRQTKNAV
jgi:hypothetical protein